MIEAPHFSAAGAKKKAVRLPEALFDGTVNEDVLHRAVVTFLANQRQGTAQTKTRANVSGGNQKPWRQKGTGRARQGSTRAPHWRHGGIVFGPHPRDYRLGIPKKMRQLAKKSALNARAREDALFVVDALAYKSRKPNCCGAVTKWVSPPQCDRADGGVRRATSPVGGTSRGEGDAVFRTRPRMDHMGQGRGGGAARAPARTPCRGNGQRRRRRMLRPRSFGLRLTESPAAYGARRSSLPVLRRDLPQIKGAIETLFR